MPGVCLLLAAGPPSAPTSSRVHHDGEGFVVSSVDADVTVPDGDLVDHLMSGVTGTDEPRALLVVLAQVDDVITLCVSAYRDDAGWSDVRTGQPLSGSELRATMIVLLAALTECAQPAMTGASA